MDFKRRYEALNDKQREAVDTIEGPLMVVAGPGTGKTELLSMRVANILDKTDTLPENILCLTFTESGANAMRTRLIDIIGPAAYKVAIHTFHSFGSEIINRYSEYFYQGSDFRPANELSSYEILYDIFKTLPHDSPLSSTMDGDFVYLPDTLTAISELKKSGLTSDELLQVIDANELTLDKAERMLADVFSARISKTTIVKLPEIAMSIAEESSDMPLPPGVTPLANVLIQSLKHAIEEADTAGSTKPITAWKSQWLERNDTGELVFKDRNRNKKLRALGYVYFQYLTRMQEAKLYDFDDMVLEVVHRLEVSRDLRLNLQEKYLYIMVDEFQDTNLAQTRILRNLTALETGDEPNLMIVGDDDQAIYSFQGAEISNILDFRQQYDGAKLVTLTDNYRSANTILEHARSVITIGSERLERFVPELDKTLTAHHKATSAKVKLHEYAHIHDERQDLIRSIQDQIKRGTNPSDITVIARRHRELVMLLPYFHKAGIPVNYEHRNNVLESEPIIQLCQLANILNYIGTKRLEDADAIIPALLAHPAWEISAKDLWELGLAAYKNHRLWISEMEHHPRFSSISDWLKQQAEASLVQPLERMLDVLVGVPSEEPVEFTSPLYNYFFGDSSSDTYLEYLEALRTIRAKLREYRPDQRIKLADFLGFIDLHHKLGSGITSVRAGVADAPDAVNLMTAHKSKGLEFNTVYIHDAIDSAWGERVRPRSRRITYPENLPLAPSGDTFDERLRLFFVAMTRAKDSLIISYSLRNDSDAATLPASFLIGDEWKEQSHEEVSSTASRLEQLENEWYEPLVSAPTRDMKHLLAPYLESYKLSSTHLNTFIDVSRGGPQQFLLNNLLRFPQAVSPSAAYGSAVHYALQQAHTHLKSHHQRRPVEDILHDFEGRLKDAHLSSEDFDRYVQQGTDHLTTFFDEMYSTFTENQVAEQNFSGQQSMVGRAHLTGLLDLVDIDNETKTITVTDYKTGKPSLSWSGKADYEKIKLHKFKQQLMFYKLLIENSRDYSGYTVERGVLQFVEPTSSGKIVALDFTFDPDELKRFAMLIEKVWNHIVTLDLPDTSGYETRYKGILDFESDLLEDKI